MLMIFDYFSPSLFCRVHFVHTTKQTPRQKIAAQLFDFAHPPPCSGQGKRIDKNGILKITAEKGCLI